MSPPLTFVHLSSPTHFLSPLKSNTTFNSSFLSPSSASSSSTLPSRKTTTSCPKRPCHSIRMVDQNTVFGVLTGLAGTVGGIALVAWTENQGKRTEARENTQLCFECKGETITVCNVCNGTTKNPINQNETCAYCEGAGSVKCLNCAGSGVQPRFLDRLSPDDFMD